jgi:hypothetical protein
VKLAVYDLETKKGIPSPMTSSIMKVCGGWTDYTGMGISIGSVSSIDLGKSEIITKSFLDSSELYGYIKELKRDGYAVGGFNTKKFDDKLMLANNHPMVSDFDILEEIRIRIKYKLKKGMSYALDNILKANGMAKNGMGAMAPLLYQQGKIQELTDYVENDSLTELKVLILAIEGNLVDPNDGKRIKF